MLLEMLTHARAFERYAAGPFVSPADPLPGCFGELETAEPTQTGVVLVQGADLWFRCRSCGCRLRIVNAILVYAALPHIAGEEFDWSIDAPAASRN